MGNSDDGNAQTSSDVVSTHLRVRVTKSWPKQFGLSKLKELKPYLTHMIKSNTEEEYKLSFDITMEGILDNPLKASYVAKIFQNHKYYLVYFLHRIEGNLKMMGYVPAEQNHSVLLPILEKGPTGPSMSIYEHVWQLIERQNTLKQSFHHNDNKLNTSSLNFRSELIGQEKKNKEDL
jgi:hypothetical protein